jgi:hypothetical protein
MVTFWPQTHQPCGPGSGTSSVCGSTICDKHISWLRASYAIHSTALDKIAGLLQRGGRLIVHEHAWDRVDESTARWYLDRRAAAHPAAPGSVGECLAKWQRDHAGLHGYAALREELDRRFKQRYFAWAPYLYGELGAAVEQEERALIDAGAIQATGFYYVGERSAG